MTINPYHSKALKLAIAVTIPVFVVGIVHNRQANAQTLLDTTAATSIGSSIDAESGVRSTSVLKQIRADADEAVKNAKNNQEKRYQMGIAVPKSGSSTPQKTAEQIRKQEAERKLLMPTRKPESGDKISSTTQRRIEDNGNEKPKFGSSTPMMRRDGYEDNGKSMIMSIFKERKEGIAKQLLVAMQNLIDLRKRISSRIDKENQNGRDMAKAKQLLIVADTKILLAKNAIKALKDYSPASSTISFSPNSKMNRQENDSRTLASSTINLDVARKLIDNAQRSIKEAHKALNDVVVAIAHAMGLKLGDDNVRPATTTPRTTTIPTPSVSSTPIATPTATSTTQ